MIYKHTRSKHIINLLWDMNLTIIMIKFWKLKQILLKPLLKKMEDSDGIYVPPQSKKNVQFIFASTTVIFKTTLLMENMSFRAQFKLFTRIPLIYSKANLWRLNVTTTRQQIWTYSLQKRLYQNFYLLSTTNRKLKTLHQVSNIIAILICFGSQWNA